MTTDEPFMPLTHTGADRDIDAADPGNGAPGTAITPDEDDEAARHFDERMADERAAPPRFPTPDPSELRKQPHPDIGAD